MQHYESSGTSRNEEIISVRRNQEFEYQPAGFLIRGGAQFLDGVILGIMFLPLDLLNYIPVFKDNATILVVLMVARYILYFVATAWFICNKGGLPGKLLLGLKIVDVETGLFLTPRKALKREIWGKLFLDIITLGIGYLIALFRKDRRALHDLVAKSQVLRKVKSS